MKEASILCHVFRVETHSITFKSIARDEINLCHTVKTNTTHCNYFSEQIKM